MTDARAFSIVSIGLAMAVSAPAVFAGQLPSPRTPQPEWQQVSLTTGRVRGVVRDDQGRAVAGVAISAIGTTLKMVVSDAAGRFVLPLPSGEYNIRAHREGYVCAYSELVMVRPSTSLERTITMTRAGSADAPRPVMVAGVASTPVSVPATDLIDPDHPVDPTAWYLRHLKRPVLRDTGTAVAEAVRDQNFHPRTNGFFDWALTSSARLATSFFANTDFSGQVNFLTTGAIDPASGWSQSQGPRNVAYLSVSAPIGGIGDWRVRGALNSTDLASWVMLGEFSGREDRDHAYTVGMSYSTQAFGDATTALLAASGDSRSVGAVYGRDRWKVNDRLELDYGMRWDRYSYVANAPNMVSPRLSGRAHAFGRTSVVGEVAQRMVAPGSSEFLAPPTTGPWLPPERTFSSLAANGQFRAERVRQFSGGLQQDFSDGRSIAVRRFRQTTDDQAATIFGLNPIGSSWAAAHYSVAAVGGAVVDGWTARAAGTLSSRLSGSVEYALADADWTPSVTGVRRARAAAPSAVRTGHERVHDLLTTMELDIPESDTHLSMVYRLDSAFSRSGLNATPGLGARFDMQINQALPFQPVPGGRLEVLMQVSNLLRDLRRSGSLYDELLTIAPPMRILGGFQLRF